MDSCELSLILHCEADTLMLGQKIAESLANNSVSSATLFLSGTLGAGKTTLTRGILDYFGFSGAVKSPTYTLVEPYQIGHRRIYHFDLYRLVDPEELEYMGICDYFDDDSWCIVEWPERGRGCLPVPDITISLTLNGDGRRVELSAQTENGLAAVELFKQKNNLEH
jgi:tRNA threonylcarbamoyladenosine biosynthesis protein TsaE